METNMVTIEIDRDSVAAADDMESHYKSYRINSDLTLKDVSEFVIKEYGLPNVASPYVWFIAKISGEPVFKVNKYGKKGLVSWNWNCETEFIEQGERRIDSFSKDSAIKMIIEYHFDPIGK